MTKKNVMEMLKNIKDISIYDCGDEIGVAIEDFEGFDENWHKIFREVDASVDDMCKWLSTHCNAQECDCYSAYFFDDVVVFVSYVSIDV
jgi:hypothetical protein